MLRRIYSRKNITKALYDFYVRTVFQQMDSIFSIVAGGAVNSSMIFVLSFLLAVQYRLAVSSVNFFFVFMSNPIVPFLRTCILRLDLT